MGERRFIMTMDFLFPFFIFETFRNFLLTSSPFRFVLLFFFVFPLLFFSFVAIILPTFVRLTSVCTFLVPFFFVVFFFFPFRGRNSVNFFLLVLHTFDRANRIDYILFLYVLFFFTFSLLLVCVFFFLSFSNVFLTQKFNDVSKRHVHCKENYMRALL